MQNITLIRQVLDKLNDATNTLSLHLTSEEQAVCDWLEVNGYVTFVDDGQGADIFINRKAEEFSEPSE